VPTAKIKKKDLISIADLSRDDIWKILILAKSLKKRKFSRILHDRAVGLIFQKPSTRTSVSFAVGIAQLGGQALLLNSDILQIKRGESPRDTGRVLARYLDAIVIRANRHEDVIEMAGFADIPIINGLTDKEHPCQVLADLLTIMEHREMKHPQELAGFKISYLGDGNNMAHSWMLAAAILGMKLKLACPKGYAPLPEYIEKAHSFLKSGKGKVDVSTDPEQTSRGAEALYTDVWTSMGQESESQNRKLIFTPYQVNSHIYSLASPNALVMHCLPAHRGEEITEELLEGQHSVVFDQAENRLHVQKAVLATLLK